MDGQFKKRTEVFVVPHLKLVLIIGGKRMEIKEKRGREPLEGRRAISFYRPLRGSVKNN